MKPFNLTHFSTGKGICGEDFSNDDSITIINLDFFLSLSPLMEFRLPLSGEFRGYYAIVTMSNNDWFYIREESYKKIKLEIEP